MSLIHVSSLTKSYAGRTVVDDVDLDVDAGEIVGILGPNGAGKSTLVECIGGLRRRDSGEVRVDGFDPDRDPPGLRAILGMQLQEASLPKKTTPREALDLFRSFYPAPRDTDELLDRFGLSAQASTRFEVLSGGQQQRLSIALALVGNPRIAILDELTTGLDPAARREIWDFLVELQRDGLTILLVTHVMEEAQHLCDRVAILDDGRVTAFDSPDALASAAGGLQRIRFTPSRPLQDQETAALVELPDVSGVSSDGEQVTVTGGEDAVGAVVTRLVALGVGVRGLRVEAPNLDDAYLSLTAAQTPTKESS